MMNNAHQLMMMRAAEAVNEFWEEGVDMKWANWNNARSRKMIKNSTLGIPCGSGPLSFPGQLGRSSQNPQQIGRHSSLRSV